MGSEYDEDFDEDLANILRAQFRQDQGIPDPKPEIPEPESVRLLHETEKLLHAASMLMAEGQAQRGALTIQMALTTANMALTKSIQEFAGMYMALATGQLQVIHIKHDGEVEDAHEPN